MSLKGIKFSVGEMAEFYHISRQTILYYDKEDLFKPKIIDEYNGYRYYTPDQLEELDTLLMLKTLGFSLKEIKEFMKNRGSAEAVSLLKLQNDRLEKKIKELTIAKQRVEKKANLISYFRDSDFQQITCLNLEEEFLLIESLEPPYQLLQADIAMKKLMHKAKDNKQIHMFVTGTLIEGKNIEADLFLTAKYMFFPLSRKQNAKDCYCKPPGEYVQAFHVGTYESIGDTYTKIKEYLRCHNKKISGNSYEYCIFDNMISDNPKDYVAEIQIQICDIER